MIAPMVGLSHVASRELIRSYLPSGLDCFYFTEMLSARRLPSTNPALCVHMRSYPGESNLIAQILATPEERFLEPAIRRLEYLNPLGLDINMGCPVRHTLKHNWGLRLFENITAAVDLVERVRQLFPRTLSVKLRIGIDQVNLSYLDEFTCALEEAGVDWLTIHGRIKSRKHKGDADWNTVCAIRNRRRIPIIANGNIQTVDDVMGLITKERADGVMLGRIMTARPWIIWQIAQKLGIDTHPFGREGETCPFGAKNEGKAYLQALKRLVMLLQQYFPEDEKRNLIRFRFFVKHGHRWFNFGHSFWNRCIKEASLSSLLAMIEDYDAHHELLMTQRISL